MQQIDAALVVGIVGGHVVGADEVVDTLAGPAYGRYHVIAGLQLADIGADFFHHTKAFVAGDQKIVAFRRRAILCRIDLFVSAIHAHAQHAHQHSAPIGDGIERGFIQRRQMRAVGLAGKNCHCFHDCCS